VYKQLFYFVKDIKIKMDIDNFIKLNIKIIMIN